MTENTRSYTFGINVERAEELDLISAKIRDFIRTVGDGPSEIQVAINPALGADTYEEQTPAIGFVYEGNAEEIYEEEDE